MNGKKPAQELTLIPLDLITKVNVSFCDALPTASHLPATQWPHPLSRSAKDYFQ
jgi:hypothetical protein